MCPSRRRLGGWWGGLLAVGLGCLLLVSFSPATGLATDGSERLAYVYFIVADVLRGPTETGSTPGVQTNLFRRGQQVVWRAEVFDTATREPVGLRGRMPKEIEALGLRVEVHLSNGLVLPMRYGVRPGLRKGERPTVVGYWSTSWRIPDDHPTGLLRWWVVATDSTGLSSQFQPIDAGIVIR